MKQTGNSVQLTEGVTLSGSKRLFVDDTLENSIMLNMVIYGCRRCKTVTLYG